MGLAGRLPFPPPGDLPDPVIKPASPAALVSAKGFFTAEPPGKPSDGYPRDKPEHPSSDAFRMQSGGESVADSVYHLQPQQPQRR